MNSEIPQEFVSTDLIWSRYETRIAHLKLLLVELILLKLSESFTENVKHFMPPSSHCYGFIWLYFMASFSNPRWRIKFGVPLSDSSSSSDTKKNKYLLIKQTVIRLSIFGRMKIYFPLSNINELCTALSKIWSRKKIKFSTVFTTSMELEELLEKKVGRTF